MCYFPLLKQIMSHYKSIGILFKYCVLSVLMMVRSSPIYAMYGAMNSPVDIYTWWTWWKFGMFLWIPKKKKPLTSSGYRKKKILNNTMHFRFVFNNPHFNMSSDIVNDSVQTEVPLRMTEKCIEKLRTLKKFWSSLGIFLFPNVALHTMQSSEKHHHWARVWKTDFI